MDGGKGALEASYRIDVEIAVFYACTRNMLGVAIQDVTYQMADAVGLDEPYGAIVADVVSDGPSAEILKQGDIILTFNGEKVDHSGELPMLVGATDHDETVDVEIWRDGAKKTVDVTLGMLDTDRQASLDTAPAAEPEGEAYADLGFEVGPMQASIEGDEAADQAGAVVTGVEPGSAAARAGLRAGDVIRNVGNEAVTSPAELTKAIAATDGDAVLLRIDRNGNSLYLGIARA
ncbi:MAG: PDZ domain-containing protein [Pseudomonadota bacterium]